MIRKTPIFGTAARLRIMQNFQTHSGLHCGPDCTVIGLAYGRGGCNSEFDTHVCLRRLFCQIRILCGGCFSIDDLPCLYISRQSTVLGTYCYIAQDFCNASLLTILLDDPCITAQPHQVQRPIKRISCQLWSLSIQLQVA